MPHAVLSILNDDATAETTTAAAIARRARGRSVVGKGGEEEEMRISRGTKMNIQNNA